VALSHDIIHRGGGKFLPQHSSSRTGGSSRSPKRQSPRRNGGSPRGGSPRRSELKVSTSPRMQQGGSIRSRFPENTLAIPPSTASSPYVSYDEIYPDSSNDARSSARHRERALSIDNQLPPSAVSAINSTYNNNNQPTSVKSSKASSFGTSTRNSNHPINYNSHSYYDDSLVLPQTPSSLQKSSFNTRGRLNTPTSSAVKKMRSSSTPPATSDRGGGGGGKSQKKAYTEKSLVDFIKFRNNREGDYVKDLLSPTSASAIASPAALRSSQKSFRTSQQLSEEQQRELHELQQQTIQEFSAIEPRNGEFVVFVFYFLI
jgi:hypothetical protein